MASKGKSKKTPKAKARPRKPKAVKKRAASKKKVKTKSQSKRIGREIRSLRTGLRKEIVLTKNVSKKASQHAKELGKLRTEIESLKKKRKKASLSEYNRFMRQQIKKGLSFKQAAALWQKKKRQQAKKFKKRTAYNVFISMQLKQGKTMKQAIRAWNRLKNPPKKRKKPAKKKPAKKATFAKPKAMALKKPKRRRPARKARRRPAKKPKRRPVKKPAVRVRKVTVEKPVVVTKEVFPEKKVAEIVNQAVKRIKTRKTTTVKAVSETLPDLSSEEIALNMLDIYFTEIARYSLKRKLNLDEIINAYFYALIRAERKGIELKSIEQAVKNRS